MSFSPTHLNESSHPDFLMNMVLPFSSLLSCLPCTQHLLFAHAMPVWDNVNTLLYHNKYGIKISDYIEDRSSLIAQNDPTIPILIFFTVLISQVVLGILGGITVIEQAL